MADGAVNFLLEKLTTILVQKASLLGEAQGEIDEIKLELESMRSFLRDAERRKERSESVEIWVRQVREVAYEIEDIVDEFLHHKERCWHGDGLKGFVQGVVNLPKDMTARHQISSKLQKLKAKVHEVSERSKRYGFDEINEGRRLGAACDRWGELPIFADEDELVGMEENTQKMLEWLEEDEPHRTIFSIVGMGGLGKTTLVTKVYEKVKRDFDCWAWISVSQTDGSGELLRSMIKEFLEIKQVMVPSNLGSMNYMQLVRMLIDYLHPKRNWKPNSSPSAPQDTDAWALFCKKAFWNDLGRSCPKELEPLARAIMKKCEGLPLAIVAVGGLMCSRNKTVAEWKKVYESINWQLSHNPMLEQRKKLIRLWVAEGFITERKGMTMEEIAEEYLTELIFRSMVQVTETNDEGRVKTCRVHDLMRELAMTTSEKEDFCTASDGRETRLERKIPVISLQQR
ncbi:Disease resistance protein RPM1 [Vitis vinifera]|uniref:Disease resistance protein RPM1 n=1 Tax=Vitis vinifera TaxID=29760 RepID=A0A438IEN6_VITVI|nr:Disease resistance protein RPM1 [Vitis vinifera]